MSTPGTVQVSDFNPTVAVANTDIFYSQNVNTGFEQKTTALQLQAYVQAPIANSTLPAVPSLDGVETFPLGKGGLFQTTLNAIVNFTLSAIAAGSNTPAAALTGSEIIPLSQNGELTQTTVAQLVTLVASGLAPQRQSIPVTTANQAIYATNGYTPGLINVFVAGIRLNPSRYTATDGQNVVITDAVILSRLQVGMSVDIDAITSLAVADVATTGAVQALMPVNQPAVGTLTGAELVSVTQSGSLFQSTLNKIANFIMGLYAPERQSIPVTSNGQTTYVTGGYTVGLIEVFISGVRLDPSQYQALDGIHVVITDATVLANIVAGMTVSISASVSIAVAGVATPASVAALIPSNQPAIGTITGTELVSVSQNGGLVQSTLTKIGQWLLQSYTGFTQTGAGAIARTVLGRLQEDLRVTDFGADPTGVNSSDAAVLAAVVQAQITGQAVRFPAGTYLLTKSLNCTAAGIPMHPVWLVGDGQNNTNITGNLTEAFPMIDFTNNKRGGLRGLSLSTKSTSLDTCALLLAETAATAGGLICIEDCGISSSSPTAWASMIGWCSDQLLVKGSYFYPTSKYGVIFGAQNIAGVTSKFRTIALQSGDCTYSSFIQSNFIGQANAAFGFTGGDQLSFTDCYFTVSGAGCAGIFDYDSGGFVGSLDMRGVRFENQSTYAGSNCINVKTSLQSAYLEGTFSSDSAAGIFGGVGPMTNVTLKANIGTATVLFNNTGIMSNSTFDYIGGISTSVGSNANAASCYNLRFIGRASLAAVQALFGTIAGLEVYPVSGNSYRSGAVSTLFPNTSAPLNYRPFSAGDCGLMTSTAYTGGSGLATVASYAFNPAVLASAGTAGVVLGRPFAELDILGTIASGVAAGSTIAIQIVQGANSLTLLTAASVIAGTAGLNIMVKFMMIGSTTMVCDATLKAAPQGGGTPYEAANYNNATPMTPFTPSGGTITINVQVSSASSNPLGNMTATIKA